MTLSCSDYWKNGENVLSLINLKRSCVLVHERGCTDKSEHQKSTLTFEPDEKRQPVIRYSTVCWMLQLRCLLRRWSSPPAERRLPAAETGHPVTEPRTVPTEAHPPTVATTPTTARVKLPKISLPHFRGNLMRWSTFWDSFNSAIHTNDWLSQIDNSTIWVRYWRVRLMMP